MKRYLTRAAGVLLLALTACTDAPDAVVETTGDATASAVDESVWKSPVMDCQPVSSMTADFAGPNDPNAAPADIFEAEAVVREQVDWVKASDVVERSGYQDGATSVTFRVRREGHTIGEVHLSSMDSKWVVSGYGHCMEATSGGDDAVWFIPPGVEPDPAAQSFEVDVMRVGCAGGRTGAVSEPTIEVSDDRITVTFTVEPVFGGKCPGNDRVRYTVVVGEPIGDREIYDGGCSPGMHGAMSTWCIDEDPVRWRGGGQG